MAGLVNEQALEFYLQDLLHRTDLGPKTPNNFGLNLINIIEMAGERIGSELRSNANEGEKLITPAAGTALYALPSDYVEMRSVAMVQQGQNTVLRPFTASDVQGFKVNGSLAAGYITGSALEPTGATPPDQSGAYSLQTVPGVLDADITIRYWQVPRSMKAQSPQFSATNPVLLAHGMLYVYASMVFATQWTQNFEQMANWEALYTNELKRINTASNQSRYGSGAAMSAPARFYNAAPSRAM